MEDTYALHPNIFELPMSPMVAECADKFPQRIAMQLHPSTLMPHSSSATVAIGHATVSTASSSKHLAAGGKRGEGVPPEAEDSAGSLSSADSGTVEKLHFFGVYDGHGGTEASQHCAQRLHHHLSAALTNVGTVWYESNQFLCPTESDANGAVWDDGELEEVSSSAETHQQQLGRSISSSSHVDVAEAEEASNAGSNAGSNDESCETAPSGINCLMEGALRDAFIRTDEEFSKDGTAGLVGSTAVVALVGTHRVWIANCGDSRAVLSRNGRAIQVTDDHKPEREDEAERVEKAGGQVLYWNGHRVMGVLAMSRAIGDHCLRPYVIPEPEITVFARHAKDDIMLLASDGLWDVMTNQEATDLANRSIKRALTKGASRKASARVAATVLTKAAVDRGSRDNITVVIIDLSRPSGAPGDCQSNCKASSSPQAGGAVSRPASGTDCRRISGGGTAVARGSDTGGGGDGTQQPPAAVEGSGSISSPFSASDISISPFVAPLSPVAAFGDVGALGQQLDSVDLTGTTGAFGAAAGNTPASQGVSATDSAGSKLEQQMTVVAPPPPLDRQASASPFSAFTAGPDLFLDDERGL